MKFPTFLSLLAAAALAFAGSVSAATISSFQFTGGSASSSDTETHTTTSDITAAGSGLSGISLVSDQLQVHGDQTGGSRDTAVANDVYFSFSIDATSAAISLDQIDFDFGYVNKFGYRIELRGSADNFVSNLWTVVDIIQNGSTPVAARSVDLSAISGYQNVSEDTLEFRFYVGDASSSDTRYAIFDNIAVTGTAAAIPEPSTALLGGLSALLLLRRRRGQ